MEKEILTQNDFFRHDSGDCLEWVKKMIENFKKYGIDMSTKMLIIETPMEYKEYKPRIFPIVAVNTAKVKSILELTKNEKLKISFI